MEDSEADTQVPPAYTELPDLHLETVLAAENRALATIITPADGRYEDAARKIQAAVERLSGVRVRIEADTSAAGAVPITGNLVVLGNRSTNRTLEELYNRYFTLVDLRYPGSEGYDVRSLHNPFGDGRNILIVGGSDDAGVAAGAERLVEKLEDARAGSGSLSVGWLMEVRLGAGVLVPTDLRAFETWEASAGYGSAGYFGWNSISKRMAMYYMTGEPFHAREAIRLAFPDEKAKAEIAEIDTERIENKEEPLSGPYHYGAHMMVLYWDLIEESPVFTDEERLRVANAFAGQFSHPQEQGWRKQILSDYREGKSPCAEPASRVGTRHGQWSSVALYCLARYFQAHHPHPFWRHCFDAAAWHFSPLHRHAWVEGEHDNLFWYNTGMAPILSYMLLSGDRVPLENDVLPMLLRGQEALASGREPDWALRTASIGFLHKAAYLMQDGRYVEYLRRTGIDTGLFRLGQSFWPEAHLKPALPVDLVGRWCIHPIPEPMWRSRASGLPLDDSFLFASYRSAPDASGDFLLIKGMNGASRNPYHTFAVQELRLAGQTVLEGCLNQVLTRADGAVEPKVSMDAALRYHGVVGETATVVAEVPAAAHADWRRTLTLRTGQYALFVDDLTFRRDTENVEMEVLWQGSGRWQAGAEAGTVRVEGDGTPFQLSMSDPLETAVREAHTRAAWHLQVKRGDRRSLFSLIAPVSGDGSSCMRLAERAAVLALPKPALAVIGDYEGVEAELAVLAQDHLSGIRLTRAGLGAPLIAAGDPLAVEWDFGRGALCVVAERETRMKLALAAAASLRMDGEPVSAQVDADGLVEVHVPAGTITWGPHLHSGRWPRWRWPWTPFWVRPGRRDGGWWRRWPVPGLMGRRWPRPSGRTWVGRWWISSRLPPPGAYVFARQRGRRSTCCLPLGTRFAH